MAIKTEPIIKTYKMAIAYDGTEFYGWQEQAPAGSRSFDSSRGLQTQPDRSFKSRPEVPTIAGAMQDIFELVFSHPIRITGSSRTDAGVHALGQVASFFSHINIEPEALKRVWNYRLPPSIHIRSIEIAPDDFNPQKNVRQKTYHYYFSTSRPLPMVARYVWFYRYPFNPAKLDAALQQFVGTHDFKNFCSMSEGDLRSTVRSIDRIELHFLKRYNIWRITVCGQSFLHYMIRRIVGAALHISRDDQYPVSTIPDALKDKQGHLAGILPKAPAHGLLLRKINYKASGHSG